MALMKAEAREGPPALPGGATARAGLSGKPLTRAEGEYLVGLVAVLLVGAAVGIALAYAVKQPAGGYKPPDGVSLFAVFYIVTQALERLLEPISSWFGTTKASAAHEAALPVGVNPGERITKSEAVLRRDRALAGALDPEAAAAQAGPAEPTPLAEAAWWQEMVVQVRRNTATLWGVASALGMAASGGLGLFFLAAVHAPHHPRWIDVIVTGLVLGGGTKPLHDLIGNLQESKGAKEQPSQANGQA